MNVHVSSKVSNECCSDQLSQIIHNTDVATNGE